MDRTRIVRRLATLSAAALVGAVTVAAVACGGATTEPSAGDDVAGAVADVAATQDVESQASAIAGALQLGIDSAGATAEELAAAATRKSLSFRPLGCLTSTLDGAAHKVTHELHDCTGPWGLSHVSGTLTVTYASAVTTNDDGARVLELSVEGRDLKIRKATASYGAHATWVATGAKRTMTVKATSEGTTGAGRPFTRSATSTLSWTVGESCITLDGTAEATVAKRKTTTVIRGYERCRNACPEAGGSVAVTIAPTDVSVTVAFDGTNVASYTDSAGTTGAIALPCTE